MIHTPRPAAASAKCPKITAGGKWLVRGERVPPLAIQVPSRTNPPTAVTSQAISAAMVMIGLLQWWERNSTGVTLGLGGFGGHADAVAVGELAAEVARNGEQREADHRKRQRPDGDRVRRPVVRAAPEEIADVGAGDDEVETHVQQPGPERRGTRGNGQQ